MSGAVFLLFDVPIILGIASLAMLFFVRRRRAVVLCLLTALLLFSYLGYALKEVEGAL